MSKNPDRVRLLTLLKELSFAEREVTLASGEKASWYIDCKQTALTGEGHFLLGRLFLAALDQVERKSQSLGAHQAVSGMSIGADPLCSAVTLTAYLAGRTLPSILVRKETKKHGTGAYLEGTASVPKGAKVLLLEDVITTGASTLLAAERVRDGGYEVTDVLTIVDRGAGGLFNLQQSGLSLHALYGADDFLGSST